MPTAVVKIAGAVYDRGPYVDRYGHKHATTKIQRDPYKKRVKRSHKRRTPKGKRFFKLGTPSGWKKDMSYRERRALVLTAHGGNLLAAARSKQQLANVSQDAETKREAQKDATFFFQEYHKEKASKGG